MLNININPNSLSRYDSDATFNAHLSASIVSTTLFDWSRTTTPAVFAKDPTVQNFTVIADRSFVKPEFARAADPYIVVEALTYMAGGVHHVLDHWEEEVEASEKESGTLAFGLYMDPTNADRLWTLAAYESEDYLKNVHNKSPTALEVDEHTRGMRTGLQRTLLQKKGGFLYKGSPACG